MAIQNIKLEYHWWAQSSTTLIAATFVGIGNFYRGDSFLVGYGSLNKHPLEHNRYYYLISDFKIVSFHKDVILTMWQEFIHV